MLDNEATVKPSELILGIDGGGTKTVAWLAACSRQTARGGSQAARSVQTVDSASASHSNSDVPLQTARGGSAEDKVLGRGIAGASNLHAVGLAAAIENLEQAVEAAFADAGLSCCCTASACLGLAGVDREEDRTAVQKWADSRSLATQTTVVHDALPVLYAGTPEGCGVALISGTGSFAFGRDAAGATTRCGGWGPLFGDEGSGYAIALAGLRAVAQADDGRGRTTSLLDYFLGHFGVTDASGLISAIYDPSVDRASIAAHARLVFEASDNGDEVAGEIVNQAIRGLADMVVTIMSRLGFGNEPVPLALTGGVLLNRQDIRDRLRSELRKHEFQAAPITTVTDPVAGALLLARRLG